MRALSLLVAVLLAALTQPGGAGAQGPPPTPITEEIMNFSAEIEGSFQLVSIGPSKDHPQDAYINVRVVDISREPQNSATYPLFHYFSMVSYFKDNETPAGWALADPGFPAQPVQSGQELSTFLLVQHLPSAEVGLVQGFMNITMRRQDPPAEISKLYSWAVQFVPTPVATIRIGEGAPMDAGPDEFVEIPVTISNVDFYPASFVVEAKVLEAEGVTPEDITLLGIGAYYLEPGEVRHVTIGFQSPREKTWYTGSQMVIIIAVRPNGGEGAVQSTIHAMNIQGFYISENLLLVITAFLLQLALIILVIWWFIHWRGENIYGKPIPPWKIPEEKAHLERLKQEDPRAHYVRRFFLMEEEYRSALLWYYSFKKLSKKQLKAEAKVVRLRERAADLEAPDLKAFDRREARLKRRYERKEARLRASIEKRIAGLEEKLNRNYEKDYDRDHAKWEKKVEKLEERANKPFLKEQKRWAKQRDRLLAQWEKPFAKEKKRYQKKLEAAKERYAKIVKKKDKPTYKAWREQMEDWKIDSSVRKKEGKEILPEPDLLSAVVPREGFPEPLQLPPKPEIPPEPTRAKVTDLPPEPQLVKPELDQSHFAGKANRLRRRGDKRLKRYAGELAIALEHLAKTRRKAEGRAAVERRTVLAASAEAQAPGFVARVLGRTPDAQERRHRRAFIRGQTRERVKELRELEEAGVERVRIEAQRREAELEAKVIRARAEARKAASLGGADSKGVPETVVDLESRLKDQVSKDREAVARAEAEAKQRVEKGIKELQVEEETRLAQVDAEVAPGAAQKEERRSKA